MQSKNENIDQSNKLEKTTMEVFSREITPEEKELVLAKIEKIEIDLDEITKNLKEGKDKELTGLMLFATFQKVSEIAKLIGETYSKSEAFWQSEHVLKYFDLMQRFFNLEQEVGQNAA